MAAQTRPRRDTGAFVRFRAGSTHPAVRKAIMGSSKENGRDHRGSRRPGALLTRTGDGSAPTGGCRPSNRPQQAL